MVLAILVVGLFFASYTLATAADRDDAQGLVDRARVTFSEFMRDPNYSWVRENINQAKGVLIFPQNIKGGFIWVAPEEPVSGPTRHRAYLRRTGGGPNLMAHNESTGHNTIPFTREVYYLAVACAGLFTIDWLKDLFRRTFLSESIVVDPKIKGKGKS